MMVSLVKGNLAASAIERSSNKSAQSNALTRAASFSR